MADALGSVIVIISALIMWFLPYQVFTLVAWALLSTYSIFRKRRRREFLLICQTAKTSGPSNYFSSVEKVTRKHKCVTHILLSFLTDQYGRYINQINPSDPFWSINMPSMLIWMNQYGRDVDPGLSLMLVLLILKSVWPLLIESALILLQVELHMSCISC